LFKKPKVFYRKERQNLSRIEKTTQVNFCVTFWNQNLSELKEKGILKESKKNDVQKYDQQTLGQFLTDNKFNDFGEFKEKKTYADLRKLILKYRELSINITQILPEIGWTPWEAEIAYGNQIIANSIDTNIETTNAIINSIVDGSVYWEGLHKSFKKGYPIQDTELILERQSSDAKIKAVKEGASNCLDSISKREKIGQFGLGIKQLLMWLMPGKGELKVLSRSKDGKMKIRLMRRGYDGKIYNRYPKPTEDDNNKISTQKTGTRIELNDIKITAEEKEEITAEIRKFRYVPETEIAINKKIINGYDKIKVLGRKTPVKKEGKISIEFDSNSLVIADTGSGMNDEEFFKMFLPGHGKGYKTVSLKEAKTIAKEQSEVLLVEEEDDVRSIAFTRNREPEFTISVPNKYLNLSSKTICLELGRILKVSEGREGFEFDENIVEALPVLVTKILNDPKADNNEKTSFLNSLILGLDSIIGQGKSNFQNKQDVLVKKAKHLIRQSSNNYLESLIDKGCVLLPNLSVYQKIKQETLFVDSFLLKGLNSSINIYEHANMTRLQSNEGINSPYGWKIYTAQLNMPNTFPNVKNRNKLTDLRKNLNKYIPTIIDSQQKVAILDEEIWEKIQATENETIKDYWQECIQVLLNKKILTGYESKDPREIFVQNVDDIPDKEKEENEKYELPEAEKMAMSEILLKIWQDDEYVYYPSPNGVIFQVNAKTKKINNKFYIPELDGATIDALNLTEKGCYILTDKNELILIDNNNRVIEKHSISVGMTNPKIQSDGTIITMKANNQLMIYDSKEHNEEKVLSIPIEEYKKACVYENFLIIADFNNVYILNKETGEMKKTFSIKTNELISSKDGVFVIKKNYNTSHNTSEINISFLNFTNNKISLEDQHTIQIYKPNFSNDQYFLIPQTNELNIRLSNNILKFDPINKKMSQMLKNLSTASIKTSDFKHLSVTMKELFEDDNEISYQTALTDILLSVLMKKIKLSEGALEAPEKIYNFENNVKITPIFNNINGIKHIIKSSVQDVLIKKMKKKLFNVIKEEWGEWEELNNITENITQKSFNLKTSEKEKEHIFCIQLDNELYKKSEQVSTLINLLRSEKFNQLFNTIWQEINVLYESEEIDMLKAQFLKNTHCLLDLDFNLTNINKDSLQLLFFTSIPWLFLELSQAKQSYILEKFNSIDSLNHKKAYLELIQSFLQTNPETEKKNMFFNQLDKLINNNEYKEQLLQNISNNINEISNKIQAPEKLLITDPLRSYLLFLTDKCDFIRHKEPIIKSPEIQSEYKEVLPENCPIELLLYLRKTEGLFTTEAMKQCIDEAGGVEALLKTKNLAFYQDEVRKSVHAQSVEVGTDKRELIQNALAAINELGIDKGKIIVDFYLQNSGTELVEEITDNGTGLQNLVAFLLPTISNKDLDSGRGVFGSGLYKIFENIDKAEITTVVDTGNGKKEYLMNIETIKNKDGKVQKIILKNCLERNVDKETEVGTKIKMIQKTEGLIPELTSMVNKNTYVTMAGLTTNPEISQCNMEMFFVNEKGEEELFILDSEIISSYELTTGEKIHFVKCDSLPSSVSSGGLKMSILDTQTPHYVKYTSNNGDIFTSTNTHLVAEPSIRQTKDRSKFADKKVFLEICNIVATEDLKQSAYHLLDDINARIPAFPEDIYINENYYRTFTSKAGIKAKKIADKINDGKVLNNKDIKFLNEKTNLIDNRFLILLGIEEINNGKKDSLLRRFQLIQNKAGNNDAVNAYVNTLDIEMKDTQTSLQFDNHVQSLSMRSVNISKSHSMVGTISTKIEKEKKVEGVITFDESDLLPTEKKILKNYFEHLGIDEIFFAEEEKINAKGVIDGKRLFLSTELLNGKTKNRLFAIIHESSHLLELRLMGVEKGVLDSNEDEINAYLTHQQEGPFADCNKIATLVLMNSFLTETSET